MPRICRLSGKPNNQTPQIFTKDQMSVRIPRQRTSYPDSIERRKDSNDSTLSGQTIEETKRSIEKATTTVSNEIKKHQKQEYPQDPTFSSSCGTQTDLSHIHQVYIVPKTISIHWLPSPNLYFPGNQIQGSLSDCDYSKQLCLKVFGEPNIIFGANNLQEHVQ